eukprot:502804-Pleurochrysis_carterae.AAC.5
MSIRSECVSLTRVRAPIRRAPALARVDACIAQCVRIRARACNGNSVPACRRAGAQAAKVQCRAGETGCRQ